MNMTAEIPEGLKVDKFLEIKRVGRGFSQKLRIEHGGGIFTEEWYPVCVPSLDLAGVDWDKSDVELAAGLPGTSRSMLGAARRRLGHSKLGTAKYRHIDWRGIDWSKNDGQLSGELKIDQQVVRDYRNRLFPDRKVRAKRVVTEEMIGAVVDWAGTRDIELARRWVVSRERVRQIRQQNGFPRCEIAGQRPESESGKFRKWLAEHRSEIEGKLAFVVARMPDFPLLGVDRRLALMRQSGIGFVWVSARRGESVLNKVVIDWGLPNWVLAMIWNRSESCFTNRRSEYQKPKQEFGGSPVGKGSLFENGEVLVRVKAQLAEAEKLGVKPRLEELQKMRLA